MTLAGAACHYGNPEKSWSQRTSSSAEVRTSERAVLLSSLQALGFFCNVRVEDALNANGMRL